MYDLTVSEIALNMIMKKTAPCNFKTVCMDDLRFWLIFLCFGLQGIIFGQLRYDLIGDDGNENAFNIDDRSGEITVGVNTASVTGEQFQVEWWWYKDVGESHQLQQASTFTYSVTNLSVARV